MLEEFESFLAAWLAVALRGGSFHLPTRAEITAAEFHPFFPGMMIARWDMERLIPENIFVGELVDKIWNQDVRSGSMQSTIKSDDLIAAHIMVSTRVVKEQLGAEVTADLTYEAGQSVRLKQFRLPLEPEDGNPLILSLHALPELKDMAVIRGGPTVSKIEYQFVPLKP